MDGKLLLLCLCLYPTIVRGNCSTMGVCWAADQHAEWMRLHLGRGSLKKQKYSPRIFPAQYSLTIQDVAWLKQRLFQIRFMCLYFHWLILCFRTEKPCHRVKLHQWALEPFTQHVVPEHRQWHAGPRRRERLCHQARKTHICRPCRYSYIVLLYSII